LTDTTHPSTLPGAARQITELRPTRGLFDLDLGAVWRHRELLQFLVWRELKVRYKQAALGIGWAIIQPVFAALIFTVVFGLFARMPSDGVPYPIFAFAGILPWTYFAEALRRSATGLVTDAELVRKIYFPRLIIPIAMVVAPLIDFLLAFGVLLLMMVWYGVWPTWHMLYLPLLLLVTVVQALAVGLWLGPVNVRFRDVMHTLPFVIQVWMYASPIVYPLSMVPAKYQAAYSLNPMVGVIEGFRWALLGTGSLNVSAILISMSMMLLVLLGGLVYFRKMERSFADVI
jgi:lipopolysaccharide transport system permease protein